METKSDDLTRISVAPPAIPSAPVPPAPTAQEIHEFEIKKLYHEVTDGLEKKNTLGYDNSVSSLTHALNSLSEESTQRFLQLNFYKMVSILLDQNPAKIGGFERGRIEDSLELGIQILAVLLKQDDKHIEVLLKIFSRTPTYYAGSKTAWTHYPGDPHVRLVCVTKFQDLSGFETICALMAAHWLGADKLQIILSALRDVDPTLTSPTAEAMVSLVMKQFLELPDDVLKKESTDSMALIMSPSGLLPKKDSSESQIQTFYQFWLALTLKMMNCNSIVVKLFAWDQIQAIIKESRHTRPPAKRYLVRNAGTEEVNGIYEGRFKLGEVPMYVRPAGEGERLFTLFRCTMRSKQKWWFISIADVEKPGTDKDIDYYQHKSTPEQDMEPPVLGWVVVSGANAHAIEPAPVLIRLETITDENGQPIMSLMDLLIEWSSRNNLLERVFGYHSIHREIVSRSTHLLTLLCDEDKLTEGDIHAIWKVGMTNPSEEISSEVLTLLANSALHMSDSALDILIDLVLQTLSPPPASSPGAVAPTVALATEQANIIKVAEFVDKIHYEGIKYIRCLTDHAKDRVIELVWKLYANPMVESYKNHGHIQDLLSICLRYHTNKNALLITFFDECITSLNLLAPVPLGSTETPQDSATGAVVVDEKRASRFVHALEFLMSLCGGLNHDSSIEQYFTSTQFHAILFNELKRFLTVHCSASASSVSGVSHSVNRRLHLLRIAYGISASIKLSVSHLDDLWSLFYANTNAPAIHIQEEFFNFLRLAGVKEEKRGCDSCYHLSECYHIFEKMLCNPAVDWSLLNDESFVCFQTYFNGLLGKKGDLERSQAIRGLGLETLWNIILQINSEISAKDGIIMLLAAYQEMISSDASSYQKLLEKIFSHLREILKNIKMNNSSGQERASVVPSATQREISRCTDVLNRLLSQAHPTPPTEIPHGLRGIISRIKLTIKYREVVPSTTNYITVYNKRTPQMEKSPEKTAVIDVNSHHTVGMLKDKIRALVAAPSLNGAVPFGSTAPQTSKRGVTLEYENAFLSGDHRSLSDLGVSDGATVIATILQSQSITAYDVDDYHESYYTSSGTMQSSSRSSSQTHPLSLAKLFDYLTSPETFGCLMELAQVLISDPGEGGSVVEEASRKVWEIMMALPPQKEISSLVTLDFNSSLALIGWEEVDSDFEDEEDHPPTNPGDLWTFMNHSIDPIRVTYILQMIDYTLQPAAELTASTKQLPHLRNGFVLSNGFLAVFKYFITTASGTDFATKLSQSVALHIIHYCLHDPLTREPNSSLIRQIEDDILLASSPHSNLLIEKFLLVAYNSAQYEETDILQRALETITSLLQISSFASQLTENYYSKSLLTSVLKNKSKTVRSMACNFAVEINKSQPVVIEWLIDEFEGMHANDEYCYDIIQIINLLLTQMIRASTIDEVIRRLITLLAVKLQAINANTSSANPLTEFSRQSLLGCLELVTALVDINCKIVVTSQFGQSLVTALMSDYLFAIPQEDGLDTSKLPLCDSSDTRSAAFLLLKTLLQQWPSPAEEESLPASPLPEILSQLETFNQWAVNNIKHSWSIHTSYDMKKSSIPHLGLKNQGCTCYLNSLVQQLYMNSSFREIIMSVKIHKNYRSSLWHYREEELVGQVFLFEWVGNNVWKCGQIMAYDPVTRFHSVSYEVVGAAGAVTEMSYFNVHIGRPQKETGRVRHIHTETEDSKKNQLSEKDYAALYVLEQLQRLFCYLKRSKKRYYDPKMFIESCKTLNLNFNIYHQNDATEFYDQLLDRLETAMKGAPCLTNLWSEMKSSVFGGLMLAQKIPKECSAYEEDKTTCGHWQSTRKEGFLKTELLIRNKEKIEDSLSQLVEGELMDGDNKIMCDVCVEKKDTVRRTCYGTLPNLLVVHLKRFDLDFTTFETIKLNNKMAFPTTLDMFPYTKEGIEYFEALEQSGGSAGERGDDEEGSPALNRNSSKAEEHSQSEGLESRGNDPTKPDSADYAYELQGVLVHSGIAQGGHYYSFIREDEETGRWYLFDDDDVTSFNPENIPVQCFGGSYQATYHGVSSMIEEDRSSNALMLFYKKVKSQTLSANDAEAGPSSEEEKGSTAEQASPRAEGDFLDGYQAFDREINESNRRHTFINYLVDPHLHAFVRDLLKLSLPTHRSEGDEGDVEMDTDCAPPVATVDLAQRLAIVKFASNFFLNIVLHCRERSNMKQWIQTLKEIFSYQATATVWLLRYLIGKNATVLREFLFHSGDALARGTFVQLIVAALTALYSQDAEMQSSEDCLRPYLACKPSEIIQLVTQNTNDWKSLFAAVIFSVLKMISEVPSYLRSCDEVMNLVRDMASLPPVRQYLVEKDVIALLIFFIAPDTASQQIKDVYQHAHKFTSADVKPLYPVIYEAVAALLNIPQKQRVPLLIERTSVWDPELTPEVKEVLSVLFKENAHYGGMDSRDIIQYMDRVHESDDTVPKVTTLQVRSILDRYDTNTDGRLALTGFLRYYADTALYNPKSVWKDLKAFGFQNDLSRAGSLLTDTSTSAEQLQPLALPIASREALLSSLFLEIGLESAETVTGAITKRVCWKDQDVSVTICKMVLHRLKVVLGDWSWNPAENLYLNLLRLLVRLDDGLVGQRLAEIVSGPEGLLTVIVQERSHPPRQVVNAYTHVSTFESRPLTHRYLDLLHELYTLPQVAEWIVARGDTGDADYQWLASQLSRTPHTSSSVPPAVRAKADALAASLEGTVIIISGSGAWEVDGRYTFDRVLNGAGMFRKAVKYEGEEAEVLIYRCKMQNNSLRWFISIAADQEPGTDSDTDFYYSTAGVGPQDSNDGRPPTTKWTSIDRKYDPTPSLSIIIAAGPASVKAQSAYDDGRSDDEDDDSDHEDSMAVIDDDFPYTQSGPGTPIDIPPSP